MGWRQFPYGRLHLNCDNKRKCTIATDVCLHRGFSHFLSYLLFNGWILGCGLCVDSGRIVDSGRRVDSGYAYLMLTTHQKKFQLNRLINVKIRGHSVFAKKFHIIASHHPPSPITTYHHLPSSSTAYHHPTHNHLSQNVTTYHHLTITSYHLLSLDITTHHHLS